MEHSTQVGAASARWVTRGGTVWVRVILDDDSELFIEPDRPLGECFDLMPRELWDRVRHEYECRRDPALAEALRRTTAWMAATRAPR